MNRQKLLIIAGLLSFTLFYLYLSTLAERNARESAVTSLSSSASGLSLFYEFGKRVAPRQLHIRKHALLLDDELKATDLIAIFSPLRPISDHEAAILSEFIQRGGTVLITFHNEATWRNFSQLRTALSLTLKTKDDDSFENFRPTVVEASNSPLLAGLTNKPLFPTLAYYSQKLFDQPTCVGHQEGCYLFSKEFDNGKLIVLAGLTPLSNSMIGIADNRLTAISLLQQFRSIELDEYRHFFSDKTLSDLLLLPSFTLPLIALLLGGILFFAYGYQPSAAQLGDGELGSTARDSELQPVELGLSYHEFNKRLLCGLLAKSKDTNEVARAQLAYLIRLFPDKSLQLEQAIDASDDLLTNCTRLLLLHKQFLNERTGEHL